MSQNMTCYPAPLPASPPRPRLNWRVADLAYSVSAAARAGNWDKHDAAVRECQTVLRHAEDTREAWVIVGRGNIIRGVYLDEQKARDACATPGDEVLRAPCAW